MIPAPVFTDLTRVSPQAMWEDAVAKRVPIYEHQSNERSADMVRLHVESLQFLGAARPYANHPSNETSVGTYGQGIVVSWS